MYICIHRTRDLCGPGQLFVCIPSGIVWLYKFGLDVLMINCLHSCCGILAENCGD